MNAFVKIIEGIKQDSLCYNINFKLMVIKQLPIYQNQK